MKKIGEKIGIGLAYLMQFLIVVFIIIAIYKRNYYEILSGILCLITTFFPLMLKRKWNITLPWTLNLMIVASLYLYSAGEVAGLYTKLAPFYDKFGHFFGSITIALLGFTFAIILEKYSNVKFKKIHIILFIIIFTMALGAFWEIIEFISDKFFGTFMQKSSDDTMLDLIFDLLGGLFIAALTQIRFETMKDEVLYKNYK